MSETREELQFNDSQKTDKNGQVILGTLEGCCADIVAPTRNGRKYSEQLWEKVFNSPIVKELFNCGGILGELDHPQDRTELDTSKVAICMPEPPTKKDGKLWGKWHILDTPNGRIAATLAKYGYKLGISSRGSGDLITDYDGQEAVDPDTYEFTCFDLVIIPAVEAARLSFHEGLERKKTLSQALSESLNNASADDRKIMEESLEHLGINLNETLNQQEEVLDDIDVEVVEDEEVDNNESIIEQLQESLAKISQLENSIIELQEKLSVCYAKETSMEDEISKYKKSISRMAIANKRNALVSEKLEKANKSLQNSEEKTKVLSEQLTSAKELNTNLVDDKKSLKESLMKKNSEISRLGKQIDSLQENLKTSDLENKSLQKTIDSLKEEMKKNKSDYASKLDKSNLVVEKYKKIASGAVDRYIKSQALRIGVSSNEIKNRLPESYNFKDIDDVCEDLQEYKVTMSKLPFATSRSLKENVSLRVNQTSTKVPEPANRNFDDDIDEQLKLLAGI